MLKFIWDLFIEDPLFFWKDKCKIRCLPNFGRRWYGRGLLPQIWRGREVLGCSHVILWTDDGSGRFKKIGSHQFSFDVARFLRYGTIVILLCWWRPLFFLARRGHHVRFLMNRGWWCLFSVVLVHSHTNNMTLFFVFLWSQNIVTMWWMMNLSSHKK